MNTFSDSPSWAPSSYRDVHLTRGADLLGIGLEIGAANNPILGSARCKFVDYADTDTIKDRLRHSGYAHADSVVDIDYVWPGSGSLSAVVGSQRFQYAIASHVIEHVPNPLGWFRGVGEVLTPGGVFNLAIPDKRFTFDIACPESSLGELIEADLQSFVRPSARQVFDSCYYGKAVEPGEPWFSDIDLSNTPPYSGAIAPQLAFDQARRAIDGEYFDSHCWAFTPRSFLNLLTGACDLGLFDYLLRDFHPTIEGKFEFFLSLEKPPAVIDRAELRKLQLDQLAFFQLAISNRDRIFRLLAE